MIETSPEYKIAIQDNMRGSMEFRASVGVENITFKAAAVLKDNGHLFFSNLQGLITERVVDRVNVTAETNMYILDGNHELLPDAPEYQGFVSDIVSNTDGLFDAEPIITIIADDKYYDLSGLMLEFDTINNDYATDFTINYYFNTNLVKTINITNNTDALFISEERVDNINKIELIFIKTHNIHRRLRLFDIVFGVTRIFTGEDRGGIVSMSHKTKIHPLMSEIPQSELTFEIRDPDMEYNPENPSGIWRYMIAGQIAQWDYYFNVSHETREHVPGGKFYLKNPPTTQGVNVKFQFTGLLQTLTKKYTEGRYYPAGRTYYDLFADVLTFSGLPTDAAGGAIWQLDERLKNYKCYLPLPIKSCVELIQILCQNTASIAIEDTSGNLHIKLSENNLSDNILNLTTAYEYPSYDPQLPPLHDILLTRNAVSVEDTVTEIHNSSQLISGTKQIFLSYEASTEQVATVSGGMHSNPKYFAYGCLLTITANNATVNIRINGRRLTFSTSQRIYEITSQGEDALVTMDLLSDDALCDELAVIYAKYLQETKRYKYDYLGDPARRANDLFPIDTRFTTHLPAQVIASEYSFNNGSKGVLELKNFGQD